MSQYNNNSLLQERYHKHSYADRSDNVLYYIFSRRDHCPGSLSYADIWRERCPCPHGPRCRFGTSCCFDRREPKDFTFAPDPCREEESRQLFREMKLLFCRRTPVIAASAPSEQDEDLCAEVLRETCPKPEPGLDYELHPYNLIQSLGLDLLLERCRHFQQCRKKKHECDYAHSVDEMLAPFADPRVRAYYMYWIRYAAVQQLNVKHRPELPLQVRSDTQNDIKCRGCQETKELKILLCVAHPSSGLMPSLKIRCSRCNRNPTLLSVYL